MNISAKSFLILTITAGLGWGDTTLATNANQTVANNSGQSQYTLAQFSSQDVASRDNDSHEGQEDHDDDSDDKQDNDD
ncbi:hypothetical protein [Synechocystis salina]|uniref:Secreted protein n=1 Tax=Synechocystis salina LEGE 00031 TaxID=1828736 RepID=A0ABR9VR68_9SYNC|nr:hypothetical protein [Synechocystis salina]MBE9242848.1 hypothetical protein [Synechocystis salina LEGE 00041]MBE9253829.1 hypothetical protein [Synechocystis salina LEGE 00031]